CRALCRSRFLLQQGPYGTEFTISLTFFSASHANGTSVSFGGTRFRVADVLRSTKQLRARLTPDEAGQKSQLPSRAVAAEPAGHPSSCNSLQIIRLCLGSRASASLTRAAPRH